MKAVVLQTFREHEVAERIDLTLQSVREWADAPVYDHVFTGDKFFDYAPPWGQEVCGRQRLPATDFTRLHYLKDYFGRGCDRVVWADAEVLVLKPRIFIIDVPSGSSLQPGNSDAERPTGPASCRQAGHQHLSHVLRVRKRHARLLSTGGGSHPAPNVLQQDLAHDHRHRVPANLARKMPVARLNCVGLFPPPLMADIAVGQDAEADPLRCFQVSDGAANLCCSMTDSRKADARKSSDMRQSQAISRLLESGLILAHSRRAKASDQETEDAGAY